MATAAGDSTGYGGGAGGKFRRRPFRKPQTTPYDRPPTALRITRRNDDSSSSGGWLSRIVDPASKLITASAHKLFSSVFRKRLLPPPQPSKDEDVEPLENHFGDAMAEAPSSIKERDTTEGNTQNGSMTDGVTGLANILKQKTFTRSEIDRLTALLHSREVVNTATQPPAGHSRQNEICGTAFENGFNPFEVSGADLTPAVRSNINVGDIASPTDLAKVYMGSMSTRVSLSTLGSHSQAVKEGTTAFTALASHRSSVSIMPKLLTPVVTSQKDFVVPKSRGRSAIYSMARTPYFKAQQTVNKGLGTYNDAFDGNPLSSSQKTLKRRSSALESDIGSVGPIRRIRQKPNLLYQKTLGLPSSCPPSTSATPSGVGEASSSKLHEERGEKGLLSSPHVSSQSIEMGQRILQQLEKLTPPKDKYNEKNPGFSGGISSMKLTPAMLSGQARKSLETVDSLKYVQGDEVCEKKVDSWDTFRETQYSITNEQNKFYNNSSKVLMNSSSNAYPENGEARSIDHDVIGDTNNTAPIVIKSTIGVPKKSPAFQMSAYEDDLDMDEDAYVTPSVNEGKIKLGASYAQSNGKLPEHPSLSEASKVDSPVLPEVESSSNSVLKNATIVEVSNTAEKGICHDKSDLVLNNTIGSSILSSQPVKISVADFAASTVSPDLKSSDKASLPSFSTSSAAVSSVADVTSSSFAFGAASAHAAIKSPGSNNNSTDAVGLFKQADTVQTSVPGSSINTIGSFGSFPLSSTVPSPVMFSSPSPFNVSATKDGADGAINSATAAPPVNGSSDNVKVSVAFPSFQSTFGGSSLTSDSATMAAPGINTTEKSKETNLGNSTSSNLFGAASVHAQNSAASSFQFGAPVTSGAKSQLGATDKVSNGSIFGDQTLPSTSASVSTTERVICQPASSIPSGSAPISSSFAFGSSSPGSSSAFSFGTSSMSAPANGSSTTVAFGSSSTSTAAPPSGSASSGFTFGTPSISAPASGASNGGSAASSSLFGFGASSSTPSTSPSSTLLLGTSAATASSSSPTSTFSFGASPATTTSSAPSSSTLSFGLSLTSSSNAPSSSTFISGASSVPPTSSSGLPSTFSFGVSPASSSAPSSTFAFGASPASSSAPSSTFAFGASLASSSAPSSTFSFGASPTSSSAPSSTFSFGASPTSSSALSSTFSFGASPTSSSAPSSTFSFGASPTSSSAPSSTFSFGASPASSSAPSPAFSFGSSSAPTSSNATPSAFLFGASSASATTTTAPVFPFGSAAPSTTVQPSQPAFGTSPVFGFGSTPSPSGNNNDQMSMEDSMVEDSMHQSPTVATPTPVFGQSPTNNFSFGMAQPQPQAQAQLGASPFQFGGQQNQVAASPNPFQASGSFDGGSFSLGAGGNDKSNRRIVKVKGRNRKK